MYELSFIFIPYCIWYLAFKPLELHLNHLEQKLYWCSYLSIEFIAKYFNLYSTSKFLITSTILNLNFKTFQAWDINVFGLSLLKMTFLRIVRVNNLRDIKVLVKLCSDLHLEGKYQLLGKAMGVLPLSGNFKEIVLVLIYVFLWWNAKQN